jgi:PAS domain S-box-containing protein
MGRPRYQIGEVPGCGSSPSSGREATISDFALDGIISMDHHGVVTDFNPAAEKIFGYTCFEAIGQPLAELIIPPSLRRAHRDGLKNFLATGEGPLVGRRVEVTGMRKDGSEFPVEISICRVPHTDPPVFTGFLRDLTEARRDAEALRAAEVRLAAANIERRLLQEQSARAAAEEAVRIRDDFVAVAGHELKTPLAALLMQIQVLQRTERKKQPMNLPERIEKIARSGFRLERLVDQLLDVSRITAGRLRLEPGPCELTELAREVADRFGDAIAEASCTVAVRADGPVEGLWDRLRIEAVIGNLLSNAIKFGRGEPIELEVTKEGGRAVLRVTDHGIGIDPEQLRRLFQRFERAVSARQFGGFGLGLWIVRNVVEASGGSIDVESEPGRGATFSVYLPLAATEEVHAAP